MANVKWSGRVSLRQIVEEIFCPEGLLSVEPAVDLTHAKTSWYYWVKFPTEPQLQIVLIQEDGNVLVFGENQPRRVAGDEAATAKALSFEVVAGPLVPPEIPKL